jgi:hypothetical protein
MGGHLDQGLFSRRVAKRLQLLQHVNAQHGGQRIGDLPPFLLVLGRWGSIMTISACQGTTTSISERNLSRLVCFLTVVIS